MSDSSYVKNSLLLEVGVPFYDNGEEILVESQALNGLKKWSENFDQITLCAVVIFDPSNLEQAVWESPKKLLKDANIDFEVLPKGYHPFEYFKHRKHIVQKFEHLIPKHQYVCITTLGSIGHWGNIATSIAKDQKRRYAVWFDWIIHEMHGYDNTSISRLVKSFFDKHYAKYATYKAIKNSDLGLFHGKTVYDGYKGWSCNPHLVHNIHISEKDVISEGELSAKISSFSDKGKIHIGYLGRMHSMKGPLDWIEIVNQVVKRVGPERVKATWVGSGDMYKEMKKHIKLNNLENVIELKSFIANRDEVLSFLKTLDIFLFCHLTPESPRCLIESIISATPLVGYESEYVNDLVGDRGGTLLSKVGNVNQVSDNLVSLVVDRDKLKQLTISIANSKHLYNDTTVFKHRSDLIKKYL